MERLTPLRARDHFDRRGSGLSDPLWGAPTLEDQMDDVLAVMDAAGSKRAAIAGTLEGGPMAAMFAATFPELTSHLVLYATFARATWAPGYEWAWDAEARDERMDQLVEHWGAGMVTGGCRPSRMGDPQFLEWSGRLERLAASPATIRRIFDLIGEIDVRDVLPSIRVPTLVLHRRDDDFIKIEHSRYIASRIPGARLVELEGDENIFSAGDSESIMGEIEEFITGERHETRARPHARHRAVHRHRRLDRAAPPRWATASWRFLLERHDALFRHALERHRGREVKRTGDGFLATFDGPARAIRCAASVAEADGLARARGARGAPHRRVRGDGRRPRRARRAHRLPGDGARDRERGARVGHRQGPRGGLGDRVPGPRASASSAACPASGASSPSAKPEPATGRSRGWPGCRPATLNTSRG